MTASLVMDPHPSVVHKNATISRGVELMMDHRYRTIPVVDDNGCYLGIFEVNCLLRLKEVEDKPVTCCVSQDVETVAPDTPLVETLLILYKTRSSIPVVEIVAGFAERSGNPINFLHFMPGAFPLMLLSTLVCNGYIYLRYF